MSPKLNRHYTLSVYFKCLSAPYKFVTGDKQEIKNTYSSLKQSMYDDGFTELINSKTGDSNLIRGSEIIHLTLLEDVNKNE